MQGILGIKIGMTQVFDDNGLVVPVTVVEAGPCFVAQVKNNKTDGYNSVQLAFLDKKEKRANKAEKGHFGKAKISPKKVLKEFDFTNSAEMKIGAEVKVDIFAAGQFVDVSGISKGKGFQGVVKRHNFAGGKSTHGQSDRLRAPGSIGQGSSPSRVYKGIKMGGRMGNDRITLKDVEIVKVDAENNLLYLKGSIPGSKNSVLEIKN